MKTTSKRIALFLLISLGLSALAVWLQVSYFAITFQILVLAVAFLWLFVWLVRQAASLIRSIAWAALGLVLFVPYLLFAAAVTSHATNSLRLERFKAQFLNNPPPQSSVALIDAQVGVLTGNGNHCDFIVDFEITSGLNRAAIAAHYSALPIRKAIAGESSETRIEVEEAGNGRFLLIATDAPNDAALDFRCI